MPEITEEHESSARDHELDSERVGSLGFAVITLSDTRTQETDKSGQAIQDMIRAAKHRVAYYVISKDDREQIVEELTAALNNPEVAVVVTNGGTGIAMRDTAYEAIKGFLDKKINGFGELFRMLSYEEIGSSAMLSRAAGGIARGKVVFSLPGSTNAVRLGMEKLILPQATHLYHELRK